MSEDEFSSGGLVASHWDKCHVGFPADIDCKQSRDPQAGWKGTEGQPSVSCTWNFLSSRIVPAKKDAAMLCCVLHRFRFATAKPQGKRLPFDSGLPEINRCKLFNFFIEQYFHTHFSSSSSPCATYRMNARAWWETRTSFLGSSFNGTQYSD